MIKKICYVLSLVFVLTLLAGCVAGITTAGQKLYRVEDQASVSPTGTFEPQITKEQAEDIALNHVTFTREQVVCLRSEYEIDDGIPQYDIEFYKDGWEYEFEIHGGTGQILSFDKDPESRRISP